jgi:hypothetical protein
MLGLLAVSRKIGYSPAIRERETAEPLPHTPTKEIRLVKPITATPLKLRHRSRACLGLVLMTACLLGLLPASATAKPTVTFTPSFTANSDLGETGIWRSELTFTGNEYHGQVAPLTELTIHLPAGTAVTAGPETCSRETIEQQGWPACPAGSFAGPGGSLHMVAQLGTEALPEEGTVETIFGPDEVLYVVLEGHSPVAVEVVGEGHYASATLPYGPALELSLPTIETVPGAPDISITALTLNLGTNDYNEVTLPSTCPSGHFAWAADAGFSGAASEPVASAETVCPAAGSRAGTITNLHVSNPSPKRGEVVTFTATVEGTHVSSPLPTGTVTFLDNGRTIAGCSAQPLSVSGSSATATCQVSYGEYGAHTIEADYSGDGNYLSSDSGTENVLLTAEVETPHHEETKAPVTSSGGGSSGGSGSPGGTNPGGSQTATVSSAQIASLLASQLIPSGKTATIMALLKNGGLTMSFTALETGTLSVQWYVMPSRAKVVKRSRAKPVLVASGQASFAGAGMSKVKVSLTAQGKKLLRHSKKVAVMVKGVFVSTAGAAVTASRSAVVER